MANKTASKTAAPAAAESNGSRDFTPSFETAKVPQVTRESKPNPYGDVVGSLAQSLGEKAVSFTVPADAVAAQIRLAQLAGKAHGVTVRNRQEKDGENVKVTIWAVSKISRPRKPKAE